MTYSNFFLSSLLEADDEFDNPPVKEPTEKKSSASSDKDDSNKDIKNDSKDVETEKDDFSDQGNSKSDDETDDVSTDDSDDSADADDSANVSNDGDAGLDGENDDDDSELDDEAAIAEKRKKLNLYSLFSKLVLIFKNLEEAFDKISNLDLPPSNAKFVSDIKKKIAFNLEAVNDLILDENTFTVRSYAELLVIYKIYLSDLRVMDETLRLFLKIDTNFSKIISKSNSKTSRKQK